MQELSQMTSNILDKRTACKLCLPDRSDCRLPITFLNVCLFKSAISA